VRLTPFDKFGKDLKVSVIPDRVIEAISIFGQKSVPDENKIPFPD
jgi:hypothetical protein